MNSKFCIAAHLVQHVIHFLTYNNCIFWALFVYVILLHSILFLFFNKTQIDTKGIPSIVNNQMLKKHPMAIAKIRARLEQSHGPHLPSESLASASASFSTTLPQQHSRYFEDAVPTKDFIQGFRTLSQKSCSK